MDFFALPLLLVLTSTIWASAVRIESRGQAITNLCTRNSNPPPVLSLPERFYQRPITSIALWCTGSDKIVYSHSSTFIKKVDLSSVKVPGVTDKRPKLEAKVIMVAQRKQVDHEIKMLILAGMLCSFEEKVENWNGVEKTYVYMEIQDLGMPANMLDETITEEERAQARRSGIRQLLEDNIILDEEHNQDQYFAFSRELGPPGPHAFPIMLRYAKLKERTISAHTHTTTPAVTREVGRSVVVDSGMY